MSSPAVVGPGTQTSSTAEPGVLKVVPVRKKWPLNRFFLGIAVSNWLFQAAWFWRYSARNINYDAISYIGIARHIVDRDFQASLHGYWSPLISWCIAAAAVFDHQLLLSARIVTMGSFLVCLPLLYFLSLRIWHSSLVAAFSVLCFTLARGVVAFSVYFIGADFLLTAAVLLYFILLLRCIRTPTTANWVRLGAIHGLAFLAKAFAMPWLIFCTLFSAFLLNPRNPKRMAVNAFAGLLIPMLVWTSWGMLLEKKYGRFSAGYQFKWNLLSADARIKSEERSKIGLVETSRSNDNYMVVDNMYPSSPLWNATIDLHAEAREILARERHNVPQAIKEIAILVTPGGLLALVAAVLHLARKHRSHEMIWASVVISRTAALAIGYSMLVFDGRYVLPVVPLLIALAAGLLTPGNASISNRFMRFAPAALFFASVSFLACYHASPFRTFRRDYETGVYTIAAALRGIPACDRLVVMGKGPFPEHGIGWEEGIYASYFSECRIVGFREEIPVEKPDTTVADIERLDANSILILGDSQTNVAPVMKAVQKNSGFGFAEVLKDSATGHLGVLLWK